MVMLFLGQLMKAHHTQDETCISGVETVGDIAERYEFCSLSLGGREAGRRYERVREGYYVEEAEGDPIWAVAVSDHCVCGILLDELLLLRTSQVIYTYFIFSVIGREATVGDGSGR